MPSRLETLPQELLGIIAEALPTDDFRNLRLASSKLGTVTRPFLATRPFRRDYRLPYPKTPGFRASLWLLGCLRVNLVYAVTIP